MTEDELCNLFEMSFKFEPLWFFNWKLRYNKVTDLTTSTAPARTFGSFPVTETDAVNDPSMLNTTHSVFGGTTDKYIEQLVWSPLKIDQIKADLLKHK